MTHEQEIYTGAAGQPIDIAEPGRSLKFGRDNTFQRSFGGGSRSISEPPAEGNATVGRCM